MTVRVFVSGQSNALGRDTGGPSWSAIDSRVRVWDNANPLGANGTAWRTAALARSSYGTFDNADRNNFGVWFCHRLARHLNDNIDMTIVARGATAIEAWRPGGSVPMMQECIDVWAATGQAPAHIFLWHQGEGAVSQSSPYSSYRADFAAVVADLKTGGVIDNNTIIILGGTAEENDNRIRFNRDALRRIAADNAQCFYADSNGLPTYDGTHFIGQATYSFGAERYFNAYIEAGKTEMDIWALVNEGGVPGTPGSGENKIADITPLLTEGFRLKGAPIILTTDQTYSPSVGTAAIMVEGQGPGGGGGGAAFSGGNARSASGGGAGGYAKKWIENPDAAYAVEVGLGGAGGAAGQNGGSEGSKATKFGLVLTCSAGSGGASPGSANAVYIANGGAGGAASGGDVNINGESGGVAIKLDATNRGSGTGGSSPVGSGGAGKNNATGSTASAGNSGTGFGSGGGGAASSTTADAAGGNGMNGVVIVWEYQRG